jgi:hypothetical protein
MQRSNGAAALAALAVLSAACGYDITTRSTASRGTVATYVAPGTPFAGHASYAIVTRLGVVADDPTVKADVDSPALLAHVSALLQSRGFTQVAQIDPAAPGGPPSADLVVNLTALQATTGSGAYWTSSAGYTTPAAWGFPGAAPSYPWSWTPVPARAGSLLVEIHDLKNATPDRSPVLWAAVGYELTDNAIYDTATAMAAVDQAFEQSPEVQAGAGGTP